MITSLALVCHKPGDFSSIVLESRDIAPITETQLLIRQEFAPINPADVNMMQGRYSTQPTPPFVLGNEGCGLVQEVGTLVRDIEVGDRVIIPFKSQKGWVGSYSQYVVVDYRECVKVPLEIDPVQASMMTVNPYTAYELLFNQVDVPEGGAILQNAASSAVGRWVIFFASYAGIQTVNLVRNMAYADALYALGATHVFEDVEGVSKSIQSLSLPLSLGLNGVGGHSSMEVCKALSEEGTMVTYGAMSMEKVMVPNAALIFQNKTVKGYHRTQAIDNTLFTDVVETYEDIFSSYLEAPFDIPVEAVVPIQDFSKALKKVQESLRSGKVVLAF